MTIRKSLQLTLALIKPDAVRVPYVIEVRLKVLISNIILIMINNVNSLDLTYYEIKLIFLRLILS